MVVRVYISPRPAARKHRTNEESEENVQFKIGPARVYPYALGVRTDVRMVRSKDETKKIK
jgi:hypothetical protein